MKSCVFFSAVDADAVRAFFFLAPKSSTKRLSTNLSLQLCFRLLLWSLRVRAAAGVIDLALLGVGAKHDECALAFERAGKSSDVLSFFHLFC